MKLYKSPTNEIYAYESDGSQDSIIPLDYIQVTQSEADAIKIENQQNDYNNLLNDEKIELCKTKATTLLQQTDWTTIADVSNPQMSNPYLANVSEFIVYRNKIRQYAINPVPHEVDWEIAPQSVWQSV